jgi:hypothetical protein
MHEPRRACGTSRRRVRGRRGRYTVCGLPRPIVPSGRPQIWRSGAVCLAVALTVFWIVRNTPIAVADPTHGAVVMRFTIEDFANASR